LNVVLGHFDEWQLIFYGTSSPPVNLTNTRRRGPTTASARVSPTSASPAGVSTWTSVDSSVMVSEMVTEQLTVAANHSLGTASSTSNSSVVKNVTMKDSDAENSTELKSAVLINGTFVTLPPVVGHQAAQVSSPHENSSGGYDTALTTVAMDSDVVDEMRNVTAALGTVANDNGMSTASAAAVNATQSEASLNNTTVATELDSSLLYGQVCYYYLIDVRHKVKQDVGIHGHHSYALRHLANSCETTSNGSLSRRSVAVDFRLQKPC